MDRLDGKVAIVTGGARGMGAATARLFASEGAKVVIADILEAEGRALADHIGASALYAPLDVTSEAQWKSVAASAQERFGTIDVLVNNAGIALLQTIVNFEKSDFEKVMAVNLVGPLLGMKHCAPVMLAKGKGSIVNICSTEAMRGVNAMAAYTSSKWALTGLTKVAAMEMGPHGVRVNSVHPGHTYTDMGNPMGLSVEEINQWATVRETPLQRIGYPEEIARVSLFLASDDASYVNGAEFTADGGMTTGTYMHQLPGAAPA